MQQENEHNFGRMRVLFTDCGLQRVSGHRWVATYLVSFHFFPQFLLNYFCIEVVMCNLKTPFCLLLKRFIVFKASGAFSEI